MKVHSKNTGRASSMPKGIAAGVIFAICLTLILGAILAFFISREVIRQENTGYWVMPILFLASGAGSCLSYRKVQHRRMLIFGLTAAIYLVSLMAITALFFGGRFEGFFPTALLILSGSGTAFFLFGGGKRNRSLSGSRMRFR